MVRDYQELRPETQQIIDEIRKVPYGQVCSYRDIASRAGLINGARQVARILHGLSAKYQLPWWRIIRSDGQIALHEPARSEQIERLRTEGVRFSDQGKLIKHQK